MSSTSCSVGVMQNASRPAVGLEALHDYVLEGGFGFECVSHLTYPISLFLIMGRWLIQ